MPKREIYTPFKKGLSSHGVGGLQLRLSLSCAPDLGRQVVRSPRSFAVLVQPVLQRQRQLDAARAAADDGDLLRQGEELSVRLSATDVVSAPAFCKE
jgi:hypothetical protein